MKDVLTFVLLGAALSSAEAAQHRPSIATLQRQLQASHAYVVALAQQIVALQGRNPFTSEQTRTDKLCLAEETAPSLARDGRELQPSWGGTVALREQLKRQVVTCKTRIAQLRQQVVGLDQRDHAPQSLEAAHLREGHAEISTLRREVAELRQQLAARDPLPVQSPVVRPVIPPAGDATTKSGSAAAGRDPSTSVRRSGEDDELAGALENALVRQGGRLLPRGAFEVEPEVSYFYDEPTKGRRRDHYGAAVSIRAGLPAALQIEARLPYVLRDHWSGVGKASGMGDIVLGLSKEVLSEKEYLPAAIAFAYLKSKTGQIERSPSTGSGQRAVQMGLSITRRRDPAVLFGSLSYTAQHGRFRLRDGTSGTAGDVLGGRMGAMLAVTPDTSLHCAVSANSHAQHYLDRRTVEASDRLHGTFEFGAATTIGRGLFLNVGAGIGFTPAAPKFALQVSVPMRF